MLPVFDVAFKNGARADSFKAVGYNHLEHELQRLVHEPGMTPSSLVSCKHNHNALVMKLERGQGAPCRGAFQLDNW